MNIASNQTLILANERGVGGPPIAGGPRAWSAAGASLLKRVTLLASQPDSTVLYLQADYGNAEHQGAPLPVLVGSSPRPTAPAGIELPVRASPGGPAGGSSRGIALYASTQRGPAAKPYGHIDVLA